MKSIFTAWVDWLFSPVLVYDLVRMARRSRFVLLRSAYALFLLVMLVWTYASHVLSRRHPRMTIPAGEMADFTATFYLPFLFVQFFVLVLLTPAYVAGAIAEEKERKTLEYLLATDLANREIVLSKLFSRLFNLTLLLLTGLPILALLQLLGGVDPEVLLAAYAVTVLTVGSLAALSILNSVYLRKVRDAIVITYLTSIVYVFLSLTSLLLVQPSWGMAKLDLSFGLEWLTVEELVGWFNAGNLLGGLILVGAMGGGAALLNSFPGLLRNYALFHGLVMVGCTAWAVARVRGVALKQVTVKAKKNTRSWFGFSRPAVGAQPMVWKEVFVEPNLKLNWMGRVVVLLLMILSFVPAFLILWFFFSEGGWSAGHWEELHWSMNIWVRIVGTLAACLLLLAVGIRAAGSLGSERERQTLDSLLTSPLENDAILYGKWLGSLLSQRWTGIWLALIYGLGLVTGGVHLLALPFLAIAWLVYAAFLAGLGLWYSVRCKRTMQAHVATVVTAVLLGIGPWLIQSCCCMPLFFAASSYASEMYKFWEQVMLFVGFGLTPPGTLGVMAFQGQEFDNHLLNEGYAIEIPVFILIGLALYSVAAWVMWRLSCVRFLEISGRSPYRRPERGVRNREPRAGSREPRAGSQKQVGENKEREAEGGAKKTEEPFEVIPIEEEPNPPSDQPQTK